MAIVQWTKECVFILHRVRLLPGNNVVPDDQWDAIKNHKTVREFLAAGTVKDLTPPKATKVSGEVQNLDHLSPQVALTTVKGMTDIFFLRRVEAEDKRPSVVAAAHKRLAEIEKLAKPEKKEAPTIDEEE